MGLQVRRRTKGKGGWLNFSYSDKNGVGASATVKLGKNVTYNSRGRLTINFGNGFRCVAYAKKGRRKAQPKPTSSRRSSKSSLVYREPVLSRDEVLANTKQLVTMMANREFMTHDADVAVACNVFNVIEIVRQDPNSPENRDMIIASTNELKEVATRLNNQTLIDAADVVSNYLRSTLPIAQTVQIYNHEGSSNRLWLLGLAVLTAATLYSCA